MADNNTMNFGVDLLPKTDLGYNLGSPTKRWKIYGSFDSDDFVKKVGDTMTGRLNFETNIAPIIHKHSSLGTSNPSSAVYSGLLSQNSNSQNFGYIQNYVGTTGVAHSVIGASNAWAVGDTARIKNEVDLTVDRDGTKRIGITAPINATMAEITSGTAPSSTKWGGVVYYDNSGKRIAYSQPSVSNAGVCGVSLVASNDSQKTGDTAETNGLWLTVSPDGQTKNVTVSDASKWRAALGLGTAATMDSANVRANLGSTTAANAITSNIGVTGTLPVANGGTGATTAAAARTNLGISGNFNGYNFKTYQVAIPSTNSLNSSVVQKKYTWTFNSGEFTAAPYMIPWNCVNHNLIFGRTGSTSKDSFEFYVRTTDGITFTAKHNADSSFSYTPTLRFLCIYK